MRRPYTRPAGRAGFTLIEMVVVIAIIAILAGLLTAAVMNLFGKGYAAMDRDTVTQLNGAAQRFYADYKFYPPSSLFLANTRAKYNTAIPLHAKSLEYLNTMFPRLTNSTTGAFPAGLDWSGGLNTAALNTGVTLEGDQCLIFCLGGIPTGTAGNFGCLGFNKASGFANPTTAGGDRLIYFQGFDTTRLYQRVAGNPFLSYKNAWAIQNNQTTSTYAYFCSYKAQNGYSLFGTSDCPTLLTAAQGGPVMPYVKANASATAAIQYYNPTSCQIISAGADGIFGPGGLWTPATAPNAAGTHGKDDISNFYDNILGAAP